MVFLTREKHGAGSMNDVNLVVIAYENRVSKKDDKVTGHYLDMRLHPEDSRAADQNTLALVTRRDPKAKSGYNNTARYVPVQYEAMVAAAGENVVPLTDRDGKIVGKILGLKGDLLPSKDPGGGLVVNPQTLKPSELSVHDNDKGRDIRSQIFDAQKTAKLAREQAKSEQAAAPQVETAAPQRVAAEPEQTAATPEQDEPGLA